MTVYTGKRLILFLAKYDCANVLTEWSRALNQSSSIYESKVVCLTPHVFKYKLKHDLDILNLKKSDLLKEWYDRSEFLICSLDNVAFPQKIIAKLNELLGKNILIGKKIWYFHPGSIYRNNYAKINNDPTIKANGHIYAPDLYRLSNKKSSDLVFFPLYSGPDYSDKILDLIKNKLERKRKRIILHSPSNALKGTDVITRVVTKMMKDPLIGKKYVFIQTKKGMANEDLIKLKRKTVIYLDQFYLPVATYGVTSVEALSTGCLVMSSIKNVSEDVLERCWSKNHNFPIIDTGLTEEKFYHRLIKICKKSDEELTDLMLKSFFWYQKNMSSEHFTKMFEHWMK